MLRVKVLTCIEKEAYRALAWLSGGYPNVAPPSKCPLFHGMILAAELQGIGPINVLDPFPNRLASRFLNSKFYGALSFGPTR
ncbi:hypothetical protein CTA1_8567 [Colletotrichum tanaceti]|uniref:Uncharacterized protein n=1 Tax=Colletotrichum tanaceti TaxID=1306861 RepID=A0A4U6X185_9PEZI|nr:hypothetical protein CTA1_8567 [Colletotrichum tanaceti]